MICPRCADRPGVIWMKDGTGDEFPCPDCGGSGRVGRRHEPKHPEAVGNRERQRAQSTKR